METSIPDFIKSLVDIVRTRKFSTDKVAAEEWPAGAPFFFHGSPLEIQGQIKQLNSSEKFPAIFLIEYIEDEVNVDRTKNVASSPKLKMFFMDEYDEEFDIDDQYSEVIDIMDALARDFIAVCGRSPFILKFKSYRAVRHSKWGVYRNIKGNMTAVFAEKLSGVEINMTMEIDKIIDQCDLMLTRGCATFAELMEARSAAQIATAIADAGKTDDVQNIICEVLTSIVDTIDNNDSSLIDPL